MYEQKSDVTPSRAYCRRRAFAEADGLKRREFIKAAGVSILGFPLGARAQQPPKTPVIGLGRRHRGQDFAGHKTERPAGSATDHRFDPIYQDAKALGLELSASVIARADEVIE